ncbi:hypothetical protein ACQWFR_24930, partial [Salmonella enterica subsp. enterica serovar Infantis]
KIQEYLARNTLQMMQYFLKAKEKNHHKQAVSIKLEDNKEDRAGDNAEPKVLKDVTTADNLCDTENPIIQERMEYPEPVKSIA